MIRALGIISLGLVGLGALPAAAHSLDELEAALREREPSAEIVHHPAPRFALENPAGRGKVGVLYFADAASRKLSEIKRELNKNPMSDRVQFLAVNRPHTHGVVIYLIDKTGNLRARYHGLEFNSTNMILHINALANDIH